MGAPAFSPASQQGWVVAGQTLPFRETLINGQAVADTFQLTASGCGGYLLALARDDAGAPGRWSRRSRSGAAPGSSRSWIRHLGHGSAIRSQLPGPRADRGRRVEGLLAPRHPAARDPRRHGVRGHPRRAQRRLGGRPLGDAPRDGLSRGHLPPRLRRRGRAVASRPGRRRSSRRSSGTAPPLARSFSFSAVQTTVPAGRPGAGPPRVWSDPDGDGTPGRRRADHDDRAARAVRRHAARPRRGPLRRRRDRDDAPRPHHRDGGGRRRRRGDADLRGARRAPLAVRGRAPHRHVRACSRRAPPCTRRGAASRPTTITTYALQWSDPQGVVTAVSPWPTTARGTADASHAIPAAARRGPWSALLTSAPPQAWTEAASFEVELAGTVTALVVRPRALPPGGRGHRDRVGPQRRARDARRDLPRLRGGRLAPPQRRHRRARAGD